MYSIIDLEKAIFDDKNEKEIKKILRQLKKNKYLEDYMIKIFVSSFNCISEIILIEFLNYDERYAFEYFNDYNTFALHLALEYKYPLLSYEIIKIMKKYKNVKSHFKLKFEESYYQNILNHLNFNSDNIFTISVRCCYHKISLEILKLKRYGKIHFFDFNKEGKYVLSYAIQNKMNNIVRIIVDNSSNEELNTIDNEGFSPLLYAVKYNNEELIKYLYQKSNLDVVDYLTGMTLLHYSIKNKNQLLSIKLIESNEKLLYIMDHYYNFPLYYSLINKTSLVSIKIISKIKKSYDFKYILNYPNIKLISSIDLIKNDNDNKFILDYIK